MNIMYTLLYAFMYKILKTLICVYVAVGRGAKYCDQLISLYLSVCLSVLMDASISQKPDVQNLPTFPCMLSVSVAPSPSSGVAIRYVLPVLWLASIAV